MEAVEAAGEAAVLLREDRRAAPDGEAADRSGGAHRRPWPARDYARYRFTGPATPGSRTAGAVPYALPLTRGSLLPMTYPPQPEPLAEALGEAAHTAAMAYRLMMTIADAVRRATRKRLMGKEGGARRGRGHDGPGWSADQLRGVLGDDILAALMRGADWPQLARQLVGLQQSGVDLGTLLPQMGRMTAGVHQAVAANLARANAAGTDWWANLLEATLPEGLVRDAILASPAWPDIAAAMGHLDARVVGRVRGRGLGGGRLVGGLVRVSGDRARPVADGRRRGRDRGLAIRSSGAGTHRTVHPARRRAPAGASTGGEGGPGALAAPAAGNRRRRRDRDGGGLSEFERIVLYGVVELPGREYPPPGHDYPRP
ncbi:hypothetical protein ACIBEA_16635 [Streptomyces sp. NPDC051555]|uniref:hypothetical protein n=1 Tax=Streptomyces sp. NPDC051555 TaxID=3365657 RepID=UPI0037B289BE